MSRAAFAMIATYAAATVLGVLATLAALPHAPHLLVAVLIGDVVATAVVFAASVRYDNASLYDPYWSVAPMVIVVGLALAGGGLASRQALAVGLVLLWGARLTWNFASGWRGLDHEDWRYVDLRTQHGRAWWAVSFAGVHLMPTLLVWLGCTALWPAVNGTAPLGWLDAVAFLVTGGAVLVEATADRQLRAFAASNRDPAAILQEGLWAWSRHPNYLGETSFWWGLFLLGLAGDPSWAWTGAGAVAISALFLFISIPLIERRMVRKRPAYREVQARIPRLVPWLPKAR